MKQKTRTKKMKKNEARHQKCANLVHVPSLPYLGQPEQTDNFFKTVLLNTTNSPTNNSNMSSRRPGGTGPPPFRSPRWPKRDPAHQAASCLAFSSVYQKMARPDAGIVGTGPSRAIAGPAGKRPPNVSPHLYQSQIRLRTVTSSPNRLVRCSITTRQSRSYRSRS